MSSASQSLSHYDNNSLSSAKGMGFAVIVSQWNQKITFSLRDACVDTLLKYGAKKEDIDIFSVPGSFELSTAAAHFARSNKYSAIICLGCVIQGETKHFNYICSAISNGITQVGVQNLKPCIFGVLTCDTQQQALDRSGGKYGNKGVEAAATAIEMANLFKNNPVA